MQMGNSYDNKSTAGSPKNPQELKLICKLYSLIKLKKKDTGTQLMTIG